MKLKLKGIYKNLDILASVFLLIGGLNWGFNVFNFNLVEALLSWASFLVKVVYAGVGLSALYLSIRLLTKKFMK